MATRASRLAVPLAAAFLGFLTVLALTDPRVAPPRGLRRLELADLVRQEDARVRSLRREVRTLGSRLDELAGGSTSARASRLRAQADELAVVAGTASLVGPGVTVVLDDSSASRSPTGDPNDLVVHERDIQTVVNALWAAGAEAVAVNGQRLSSLSAVRCAGNTLLLHGGVESPPYAIAAIGDPEALRSSLSAMPGMDKLMSAVDAFGLRYSVEPGAVRIRGPANLPVLSRVEPA